MEKQSFFGQLFKDISETFQTKSQSDANLDLKDHEQWLNLLGGVTKGSLTVPNSFQKHPAVFKYADFFARSVASAPLVFFKKMNDREEPFKDDKHLLIHRLGFINPYEDPFWFWYKVTLFQLLYGETIVRMNKDRMGRPIEYYADRGDLYIPVIPKKDQVIEGTEYKAGFIAGWNYKLKGKKHFLPFEEALWFRLVPDPENPWKGLSVLGAAEKSIQVDWRGMLFNEEFFTKGLNPAMAIEIEPQNVLPAEEIQQMKHDYFNEMQGSGKSHGLMIVQAGKLKQLGASNKDMEFIESRKMSDADIAGVFGMSPAILQKGTTYKEKQAETVNAWLTVFVPYLDRIEKNLNTNLIDKHWPNDKIICKFDHNKVPAMEEYNKGKANQFMIYKKSGLPTKVVVELLGIPITPAPGEAWWEESMPMPGTAPFRELDSNEIEEIIKKTIEKTVSETEEKIEIVEEEKQRTKDLLLKSILTRGRNFQRKITREERRYFFQQMTKVLKEISRDIPKDLNKREIVKKWFGFTFPKNFEDPKYQKNIEIFSIILEKLNVLFAAEDGKHLAVLLPIFEEMGLDSQQFAEAQAGLTATRDLIPGLKEFITERADFTGTIVNATTKKQVLETIFTGLKANQTRDEIVDAIKKKYGLAKARAETIAQTESTVITNRSFKDTYQEIGIDEWEWLATFNNTREGHALNHGNTAFIGQPFPNGQTMPGVGTARQVVNCQCRTTAVIR